MKGSVYKRCPCGVTGGGGSRKPACKKAHGRWVAWTAARGVGR